MIASTGKRMPDRAPELGSRLRVPYTTSPRHICNADTREHRERLKPACEKAWENHQASQRYTHKALAISELLWVQLLGACLAGNAFEPFWRNAFVDLQGVTYAGEHKKHPGIVGKTSVNFGTFSLAISLSTIEQETKNRKEHIMQMNNLVYCYKPKKSPYYYARFLGEDGTPRDRTTKCEDYDAAVRVGAAMAFEAEAVRKHLLPQHKLRAFSKALLHVATGDPLQEPNVKEFLKGGVDDAHLQKEENTAGNRNSAVKLFLAYLKETFMRLLMGSIEDIRDVQAKGFRGYLLKRYERSTVNQYLEVMTTFWNQAKLAGYTPFNPFVGVRVLEQEDQSDTQKTLKRRPLKRSEGIALVLTAGVEMTGLIVSALNIGGRNGDISGFRIPQKTDDYDADLPDVQFRNKKGKKNMDNAVLPEYEAFRQEYYLHLKDSTPGAVMFKSYGNLSPRSRTSRVGEDFASLCVATKLRDPATAPRSASGRRMYEINFHVLRYTCNMACKMSGMKTEVVRKMLSQTEAVNSIYDAFHAKELQRAELYKATGKEHLLEKKQLARVETCMTLQDIMDLTVYATAKLRCIRLGLPLPEPPPAKALEAKKVAQPVSEAAQPTSDNAAIHTDCPAQIVAQSGPGVN